jgi:hypothetical protein
MKIQLDILGQRFYDLPAIERDLSKLTIEEIIEKTREFWHRYEKASLINENAQFAPMYFTQLLAYYPVSLCKRDISDTLKLLIAMSYFGTKPKKDDKDPIWNGFSYEDLSIIFVRSKASIHAAIRDNKLEAIDLLQSVDLREEARKIAFSQLIIEEKEKMRKIARISKGMTDQTNERALTLEEGI